MNRFSRFVCAALFALCASVSAFAQTVTIPATMEPDALAEQALGAAGPYIVTIAVTSMILLIGTTVFKIVKRGVRSLGRG